MGGPSSAARRGVIHFFPMFSRDAAQTLYGQALREIGAEHRIFADHISFNYRSTAELLFVCLPRLIGFALASSWRSLVAARPAPDAVVVSSDIETLVFAAMRFLRRRKTRIVVTPFIFTARGKKRLDAVRRAYYAFVLRHVDVAIVHSRLEAERYCRVFPNARARFVFVPYGLNIDARAAIMAEAGAIPPRARPVVVSAGKSGRDYATLFEAIVGLDVEARVICDFVPAIPPVPPGARVTVLGDCHGAAYLGELARADIVALPLAVGDISAGQMVLIQAKALARPAIVTDTPTIRDYAADGEDALLVPLGDAGALRAAIARLAGDAALRARLGAVAAARYERDHGTRGFMAHLVAAAGGRGGAG